MNNNKSRFNYILILFLLICGGNYAQAKDYRNECGANVANGWCHFYQLDVTTRL